MRRLGMKGKRRKSRDNMTDSESEENGVAGGNETNNSDLSVKTDDGTAESTSPENALTPISATTASSSTTTPTGATTANAANAASATTNASTSATTSATTTPSRPKQNARKRNSRGRSAKFQPANPEKSTEDDEDSAGQLDEQDAEQDNPRSSIGKRRKKDDQKASTSGQINNDEQYEVELLVGHRMIKGRRQFLVRWKGYDENSDTWENEKDLNCAQLVEEFLAEEEENNIETEKRTKMAKTKDTKSARATKAVKNDKKSKKSKRSKTNEKDGNDADRKDPDSQKEFEVEKIVDVYFKKNKMREFLIRWKGFSSADDTWEPEENLNCPELINKFMHKVEQAKTTEMRELRTNPPHTKRYTLATHEHGRRLSRRNMDKQRAMYHECDE